QAKEDLATRIAAEQSHRPAEEVHLLWLRPPEGFGGHRPGEVDAEGTRRSAEPAGIRRLDEGRASRQAETSEGTATTIHGAGLREGTTQAARHVARQRSIRR